ncbi:hypothetical protein QYE76_005978 [Lolium multiflorum]|uniref:Gag-pol polyprotein n=1 Tax=Lolium multiflorum TaxID=4521 RepID=A0AAD8RTU8_LOLMU|nr:hypothetical protein QYE76_005978 [Lolium multiflorum]
MCLASSSSSSAVMPNPFSGIGVSEKLTRTNYLVWQSQVLPPIRGARLMSFIDAKAHAPSETITVEKDGKTSEEANPAYDDWVATDQQVLTFLQGTLSPDILVSVIGMDTASKLWGAIRTMFASQSRTRVSNLRVALARTRKENMTSAQFFAKMKGYADELAAAGRPIDEEELVEYLLAGLDDTYNPLFAAIGSVEALSSTLLRAAEEEASVDAEDVVAKTMVAVAEEAVAAGGRRGGGGNNARRGGGRGSSKDCDRDQITCQICDKPGHVIRLQRSALAPESLVLRHHISRPSTFNVLLGSYLFD